MAEIPSPPPPPPPSAPKKESFLPDGQFVCYFLIGFPGYLFATRPATNARQTFFRVSLMLMGIAGLFYLRFRKKKA
jgi:hypothetical protein